MGKSLSDEEVTTIVLQEAEDAVGEDFDKVSSQRGEALSSYFGEPYGDEKPGRSSFVSLDVNNTIEWLMPGLMRIFGSGDSVGVFLPRNEEDVDAMKQATETVNHVYNVENNGFIHTYDFIKDAILQKTGIFKVWWDETAITEKETYKGLTQEQFDILVADDEREVTEQEKTVKTIQIIQDTPQGPVTQDVDVIEWDATVIFTNSEGRIKVETVAPEEFLVNASATAFEDARFTGQRNLKTIQQLRDEGFDEDLLEDISGGLVNDTITNSPEVDAREAFDGIDSNETNALSDEMQEVEVIEGYIRIDQDGDGVAELRQVIIAGTTLLLNKEVDNHPFIVGTPIRIPHKAYGMSVADLVIDLQRLKSTIVRNQLDNMYQINNSRLVVMENQVNLDDVLDNRPGGLIRVKTLNAVNPLPVQPLSPANFEMLGYIDATLEERAGISKNSKGISEAALKTHISPFTVSQMMTAAEQRKELIARILAETGFRQLFEKIYEILVKYSNKEKTIRLNNSFVVVDPRSWKDKADFEVSVGLGRGMKDIQAQGLSAIQDMMTQIAGAQGIGRIVTEQNIFNLAAELARNVGFKDVSKFFTDPSNLEPEQPQPDPDALKDQADIQNDQAKLQLQAQKQQTDVEFKTQELHLEEMRLKHKIAIDEAEVALEAIQERPVGIGN